jgi:hypothetical protein
MRRFLAAFFLAVVCASLHAQTMNLRAAIPFPFHMGRAVLPAGEYTIIHSHDTLIVRNAYGGGGAALVTNAAFSMKPSENSHLSFHRYGDNYFLVSVWTQGERDGRELPKSRSEKDIASLIGLPETIGIAALHQ